MDLITLTLSKNHLWSALSVAGLGAITYLTNRYVKNTITTKNQTYFMAKVIGIGGIFFKFNDPQKIKDWYQNALGL